MTDIYKTALEMYKDKDKDKKYAGKFDCSLFVQYCYEKNGKNNVPRSSSEMWKNGLPGDGSAGDIACWNGHVGICDGSGNVIHCYHGNRVIVAHPISQINEWNGPLKGYRRF